MNVLPNASVILPILVTACSQRQSRKHVFWIVYILQLFWWILVILDTHYYAYCTNYFNRPLKSLRHTIVEQ